MAAKKHDIMTMDQLAEYLKISKSTLYKLAQENRLPSQKIAKHWRFGQDYEQGQPRQALERYGHCFLGSIISATRMARASSSTPNVKNLLTKSRNNSNNTGASERCLPSGGR